MDSDTENLTDPTSESNGEDNWGTADQWEPAFKSNQLKSIETSATYPESRNEQQYYAHQQTPNFPEVVVHDTYMKSPNEKYKDPYMSLGGVYGGPQTPYTGQLPPGRPNIPQRFPPGYNQPYQYRPQIQEHINQVPLGPPYSAWPGQHPPPPQDYNFQYNYPPYGYPYPSPERIPSHSGQYQTAYQLPRDELPSSGTKHMSPQEMEYNLPSLQENRNTTQQKKKGKASKSTELKEPEILGLETKKPSPKTKKQQDKESESTKETLSHTEQKQNPEKMYICVSGIMKDENTDTFMNYLEARSKGDIVFEESLRTDDDLEHAIVVFSEGTDITTLKRACEKKKLRKSSLEFEEIDPPRSVIISSRDGTLTSDGVKQYLIERQMKTSRIHVTDDGLVTVKFKSKTDVSLLINSEDITIDNLKIEMSVLYNCEHGTFWDKSRHVLGIPEAITPEVTDRYIQSFLIDIKSSCDRHLEPYHARLTTTNKISIACTVDPKDKDARQKVKEWKQKVQIVWEEFVKNNAQKRELPITQATKELLTAHVNQRKEMYKFDELRVIYPEETDDLNFIFIGRKDIVEVFYGHVTVRKYEIESDLERKRRFKTEAMKCKQQEMALMSKENEFEQLNNISYDFNYEVEIENSKITFTGVDEDISKAKVILFEVRNRYHSWTINDISDNICNLLQRKTIADFLYEKLNDESISVVYSITGNSIHVCTTSEDNRKRIENIFREEVKEKELLLDQTSKRVLQLGDWSDKKANIKSIHKEFVEIDDTSKDHIVVVATSDIIDNITNDLDKFITEHSIYEDEIKITEEATLRFLKYNCRDWVKDLEVKSSNQGLQIKFNDHSIHITGTKQAISIAREEVEKQKVRIQKDKHVISKPDVDSLFEHQEQINDVINPIEEDSNTIIKVETVQKQTFHRTAATQESDEEYVWRQASAELQRKGDQMNNDTKEKEEVSVAVLMEGPVVFKNGTRVTLIKKEDLSQQKADVIICSTSNDLNLSGPAGKSIVSGAGPEILEEIKSKYSGGIEHGEIAVVKGYKLQCKEVYLAALPGWSKESEEVLAKCINTCLQQAASETSVVFPALGTGNLMYPRDLVAKTMFNCVSKFDESNSSLKEIRFLCYDQDTITAFEKEETKQLNPNYQPPQAAEIDHGCYMVNNVSVSIEVDDLGQQQLEVLVAAVAKNLKLKDSGGAGKSLINGLGGSVQQDIEKQHPKGVTSGALAAVKLSSPVGKCKAIYLTFLDSWKEQERIRDNEKQICTFVYKCLETADKEGYTSIGIPALGTGNMGYPHDAVATYMYNTVEKFAKDNVDSKLMVVKFVVYGTDTRSIQAFTAEARKRAPEEQNIEKSGENDELKPVTSIKPKQTTGPENNGNVASVSFLIYGLSSNDRENAKQLLDEAVTEKYKTEVFHDHIISALNPKEMALLMSVKDNYPINLTADTVKNEVEIEGTIEKVISAKQEAFDWLRKFNFRRHCEMEAEYIKDQAQWYFTDKDPQSGAMELLPYPVMINMHLENAFKGNSERTDVDFKDDKGNEYIIDIKSMSEYPASNPNDKVDVIRREKVQGQGGTFEPPPEWIDQGTDNVRVVPLLNSSTEYQTVEKKFIDSVKNGKNAQDDLLKNKTAAVTKIERIQNLNLFRMYAAKRSLMEKQNPSVKNEQELWHGTPESSVVSINLYGFNRSYCSSYQVFSKEVKEKSASAGTLYGEGVYFSTDASHSVCDMIIKENPSSVPQERYMYLCLVLTGVMRQGQNKVDANDNKKVLPEALRYLPMRTDDPTLPYDSNTNDTSNPLDVVVFNDTQAYPLYLIKFKLN